MGLPGEEQLVGPLLPDLPGEVRGTETVVEGSGVRVSLEEIRMCLSRKGELTDHVQEVVAVDDSRRHDRDNGFRHEPNQPLDLKHVQAVDRRRPGVECSFAGGPLVLVAGLASSPLRYS